MQKRRDKPKNLNRHQTKVIYVSVAPADLMPDEKIEWALQEIQSDLKKNNGIYPYAHASRERRWGLRLRTARQLGDADVARSRSNDQRAPDGRNDRVAKGITRSCSNKC